MIQKTFEILALKVRSLLALIDPKNFRIFGSISQIINKNRPALTDSLLKKHIHKCVSFKSIAGFLFNNNNSNIQRCFETKTMDFS